MRSFPTALSITAILASFALSPAHAEDAPSTPAAPGATARATFAGGCFWCMEPPFEALDGVLSVTSGYTGGTVANPAYEQVSAGTTGHAEAVEITYDPAKVSYEQLLDLFWHNVDPLTPNAQFCDHGSQYRTAIFFHDQQQQQAAEASKEKVTAQLDGPVVTEVKAAGPFYPAEGYHQDYYKKNPARYKFYRWNCGRDQRLKTLWGESAGHAEAGQEQTRALTVAATGAMAAHTVTSRWDAAGFEKPSEGELRQRLNSLQYDVTQHEGTEPAFRNEYWDNKQAGIYVDVVSGEPLFSSLHKYDSGTGWPSFTQPLEPAHITTREDFRFFTKRIEARSKHADSHLGHIFDDGPAPTGQRYCINSAALRFIPTERLEAEGYGAYLPLFAPDSK